MMAILHHSGLFAGGYMEQEVELGDVTFIPGTSLRDMSEEEQASRGLIRGDQINPIVYSETKRDLFRLTGRG